MNKKCYICSKEIKDEEPKKVIAGIGTESPIYVHISCLKFKNKQKRR